MPRVHLLDPHLVHRGASLNVFLMLETTILLSTQESSKQLFNFLASKGFPDFKESDAFVSAAFRLPSFKVVGALRVAH